ncbi:hypothetical protein CEXT_419371 [Caerostris extrusa]|uniref:Uncharacterized protein n=1 Tax=Caerostris extrusa TaxID=172846 RepID=A0AAV4NE84_CAEEX|nr:hypothetical protein CEXT_419371 [Caerostris extrusa]
MAPPEVEPKPESQSTAHLAISSPFLVAKLTKKKFQHISRTLTIFVSKQAKSFHMLQDISYFLFLFDASYFFAIIVTKRMEKSIHSLVVIMAMDVSCIPTVRQSGNLIAVPYSRNPEGF